MKSAARPIDSKARKQGSGTEYHFDGGDSSAFFGNETRRNWAFCGQGRREIAAAVYCNLTCSFAGNSTLVLMSFGEVRKAGPGFSRVYKPNTH